MRKLVILVIAGVFWHLVPVQARQPPVEQARTTAMIQLKQDINPAVVDCTIRINYVMDDGTRIAGELTFVDIPWWECTAIKVGNFLSKIF